VSGWRLEGDDEAATDPMNIARALEGVREARPQAPAISFKQQTWTYADLWAWVSAWAAELTPRLGAGDRVLCLAPNHPQVLAAYVAVAGLGAIFVPVNPELSPDEIADIVTMADPGVVLTSDDLAPKLVKALERADRHPQLLRLPRADASLWPSVGFGDLDPDQGALICFTSGSTDRPKGVFASHRNELASARQYGAIWAMQPEDRVLVALPLSFLYGLTTGALTALLAGAHVLLEERFHPRHVLERISDDRATVFLGVPTMYVMMLEVGLEDPAAFHLSSIRLMLTAGAPIAEPTQQAFYQRFGVHLMDFYALSEVRPVFAYDARRFSQGRPGSCGHQLPGVEVQILAASEQPMARPGMAAELLVRSETLMKGYYGDPAGTAEAIRDGWFHTGDLAAVDEDGFYSIVGRKKDLIIRGGFNVAPAEVERAILTHPAVLEAAVVGVDDAVYGEDIGAAVTLKPGQRLEEADLVDFLRSVLADYKLPRRIRFSKGLPRGATGKVDKQAVRALWTA